VHHGPPPGAPDATAGGGVGSTAGLDPRRRVDQSSFRYQACRFQGLSGASARCRYASR
jgi:hypothetical protein